MKTTKENFGEVAEPTLYELLQLKKDMENCKIDIIQSLKKYNCELIEEDGIVLIREHKYHITRDEIDSMIAEVKR